MDWRREPILRQMQRLKLKLKERQMLKRTLKPSTTEAVITLEVKTVVRGFTLEVKTEVRGISLEDKMEVKGITLVCQGAMEGGCHLPTPPSNQAGPANLSLWSLADQATVLTTQVLDVLVVSRTQDSHGHPLQDHLSSPIS